MGPQKTVKALSNEQEEAIRNLIREEVRRVRNTQGRGREGAVDHEEYPAPEVYIALVPHGGIAAVTVGEFETGTGTGTGTGTTFGDDVPGSAICQIYYLHDDGTLKMIDGEVRRVYNANRTRIQAGSWVLVARDKLETWWVTGTVSTGGDSGEDFDLNVRELDGSPTWDAVNRITADQSTGLKVRSTQSAANAADLYIDRCDLITVVSNVCPVFIDVDLTPATGTGTGTGTSPMFALVQGVRVEYTQYDLKDCVVRERWCVDDPQDCCTNTGTGTGTGTGPGD